MNFVFSATTFTVERKKEKTMTCDWIEKHPRKQKVFFATVWKPGLMCLTSRKRGCFETSPENWSAWPMSLSSSTERVSKYPGGKEGDAFFSAGYLSAIRRRSGQEAIGGAADWQNGKRGGTEG